VRDVAGESAQDVARFAVAARDQGEALEAHHGVPAPVREPRVAGDDGTRLVARRTRSRFVAGARPRHDDELVGGEHELRGDAAARGGDSRLEEPKTSRVLRFERGLRIERADHVPGFGGRDEGRGPATFEPDTEETGARERAVEVVAARLLDEVRLPA